MRRSTAIISALCAVIALNLILILVIRSNSPGPGPSHERTSGDAQAAPTQRPAQGTGGMPNESLPAVGVLVLEPSGCADCFNISRYVDDLRDTVTMDVSAGDPAPFHPARLPALAFNQTLERYPDEFVAGWETYGSRLVIPSGKYAGTWYLLPTLNAPYVDTASGSVRGRVNVTYVGMASCAQCYDVHLLRDWLRARDLDASRERDVDASSAEGKALVSRYAISALPTIIIQGDTSAYPAIAQAWETMGTNESDGTLVLRGLERLHVTYYDLAHGTVMRP